jgi:hypothetical protein
LEILGKPVEYADNIDGIIIGGMSFERSVVTQSFVFEVRRLEVDVTEVMDFLSKRINASRPLYFYENVSQWDVPHTTLHGPF